MPKTSARSIVLTLSSFMLLLGRADAAGLRRETTDESASPLATLKDIDSQALSFSSPPPVCFSYEGEHVATLAAGAYTTTQAFIDAAKGNVQLLCPELKLMEPDCPLFDAPVESNYLCPTSRSAKTMNFNLMHNDSAIPAESLACMQSAINAFCTANAAQENKTAAIIAGSVVGTALLFILAAGIWVTKDRICAGSSAEERMALNAGTVRERGLFGCWKSRAARSYADAITTSYNPPRETQSRPSRN